MRMRNLSWREREKRPTGDEKGRRSQDAGARTGLVPSCGPATGEWEASEGQEHLKGPMAREGMEMRRTARSGVQLEAWSWMSLSRGCVQINPPKEKHAANHPLPNKTPIDGEPVQNNPPRYRRCEDAKDVVGKHSAARSSGSPAKCAICTTNRTRFHCASPVLQERAWVVDAIETPFPCQARVRPQQRGRDERRALALLPLMLITHAANSHLHLPPAVPLGSLGGPRQKSQSPKPKPNAPFSLPTSSALRPAFTILLGDPYATPSWPAHTRDNGLFSAVPPTGRVLTQRFHIPTEKPLQHMARHLQLAATSLLASLLCTTSACAVIFGK